MRAGGGPDASQVFLDVADENPLNHLLHAHRWGACQCGRRPVKLLVAQSSNRRGRRARSWLCSSVSISRPMKKAHLRRWLRRSSLQRTAKYASLLASSPPCIWTFLISLHSERCFSASC